MTITLKKHRLPEKYRNYTMPYLLKVIANNGDHKHKEQIRRAIEIK
ncbi:hypothetical protein [Vibrio galatheae]|nr:hypothetical protein [Vibrio galatheae]